jgi:hypothetical protein
VIRRAIAGRPDVPVDAADLAVGATVVAPPEPVPATSPIALEPAVATADGLAGDPLLDVAEADLRPPVDVLPLALVESLFAIRRADLRLPVPRPAAMALLACEVRHPEAQLEEPDVRRADPPGLRLVERSPTPAAAIPRTELRAMLVALYKASRASSPADLSLVGIYRRAPGGAIRSIALHGDRLQMQVDPRRRARPATLVVGRERAGGALISAEI